MSKLLLEEKSKLIRVIIALSTCVKEGLLQRLHDPSVGQLTSDQEQVYSLLQNFKESHNRENLKNISFQQWDSLVHECSHKCVRPCRKGEQKIDTERYDISTICFVVRNLETILAGAGGYSYVTTALKKFQECAKKCLKLRNDVFHEKIVVHGNNNIDFEDVWDRIKKILVDLKYDRMDLFNELKDCVLDATLREQIDVFKRTYAKFKDKDLEELVIRMCHNVPVSATNLREFTNVMKNLFLYVQDESAGEHDDIISMHKNKFFLFCHNDGRSSNVHHATPPVTFDGGQQNVTLKIYSGAGSINETMDMSEFNRRAKEYDEQQIKDEGTVEIYPPTYTLNGTTLSTEVEQICLNFETALSSKEIDACQYASIIRFYSPVYHYHLWRRSSARVNIERLNVNNIFVVCPEYNLLQLIKVTKKDRLKETIDEANNELYFMIQIYDEYLNDSNLTLSCLIVCVDATKEDLHGPEYAQINEKYKRFIITKELIFNTDLFVEFWNNVFLHELELLDSYAETLADGDCLPVIRRHMKAIMATTEIKLPSFASNIETRLSTVLLQKQQLQAINDPSDFKIFFGSFGSGKTLICQILVRRFAEDPDCLVYYIMCDSRSVFLVDMESFIDEAGLRKNVICTNLFSICQELGIRDCTDLLLIMESMKKREPNKIVNFVFDEFDLEWLTPDCAQQLRKATTSKVKDNGKVILMTQNMTRQRDLVTNDVQIPYEINAHELLVGFRSFHLPTTIRSINSINDLCRATESSISNAAPNSTYHPDVFVSKATHAEASLDITREIESENTVEGTVGGVTGAAIPEEDNAILNQEGDVEGSIIVDNEYATSHKSKLPTNLEHMAGSLRRHRDKEMWTQRTESRYHFNQSKNGITITGSKPRLFVLKKDDDSIAANLINVLKVYLKKQLNALRRQYVVIICINIKVSSLVTQALTQKPPIKHTAHVSNQPSTLHQLRRTFNHFKSTKVMVTTPHGFRGNEVKNVIVVVDSSSKEDEKYLLSEVLSRATVNLSILLVQGQTNSPIQSDQDHLNSSTQSDLSQTISSTQSNQDHLNSSTQSNQDLTNSSTQSNQDNLNSSTQSDQDLTNSSTQSDQDLTNSSTQSDLDLTNSSTQSNQDNLNSSTQSDQDLTNSSTQSDQDLTNSSTQSDLDLTNSSTQSNQDNLNSSTQSDQQQINPNQSPQPLVTTLLDIVNIWLHCNLVEGVEVVVNNDGKLLVGGEDYGRVVSDHEESDDDAGGGEEENDEVVSDDDESILREFDDIYAKRMTRFHEVTFQRQKYDFDDIFKMIKEDKKRFELIISDQPNIIDHLRNADKWTLLMKTIPDNDFDTFHYLTHNFPQQDFACVSKSVRNVFHHAAWNTDTTSFLCANDVIEKLAKSNKRAHVRDLLNKPDMIGWIPLHNAARRNNYKTAKLFLEWGSSPDARNKHGLAPDQLAGVDATTKAMFKRFREGLSLE